jgi:DNA-binding transcriptional LysR family regulator
MEIPSSYLAGFLAICRYGSLTHAAKTLNVTQPALSLRLRALEDVLEETLVIRQKDGVVLTEAGHRLLRHAEEIESLEKDCLAEIKNEGKLQGTLRVGSFSTIGRSLVLPLLAPLLRENPQMGFHFSVKELRELPGLLHSGEVDIIFMDREIKREGIESLLVGHEEYVLINGKESSGTPAVYLNHDEEDMMSFRYWDWRGEPKTNLRRRYLDEIYAVIDGVAGGLGGSVLPRHLIRNDERIRIISPREAYLSPVYLISKKRTWRPRHLEAAIEAISSGMACALK